LAWPPETTSALYQVGYASATRIAQENNESKEPVKSPAFADAREPFDMLETVLSAAIQGEKAGDECPGLAKKEGRKPPGLTNEDRLRLAEIAVAYSAATLVDNRHNSFQIPAVLDKAVRLLGQGNSCADLAKQKCDKVLPTDDRRRKAEKRVCRLCELTQENRRRGDVIAIPKRSKDTFLSETGLRERFDKEKDSVELKIIKEVLQDDSNPDVYYVAPEHLIDAVSVAIHVGMTDAAGAQKLTNAICGNGVNFRNALNLKKYDPDYTSICPEAYSDRNMKITLSGPSEYDKNIRQYCYYYDCDGNGLDNVREIFRFLTVDFQKLRERRRSLFNGLNNLPPDAKLVEYVSDPTEKMSYPEVDPNGANIDAIELRDLVKGAYKDIASDSPEMLGNMNSYDFEDLSRLFRGVLRRREDGLIECNDAVSAKNDDKKRRWIDRHLDDLPDHRSFQRVIGKIRDDKYAYDRNINDNYTSAILVIASEYQRDHVCELKEVIKQYGIRSRVLQTVNVNGSCSRDCGCEENVEWPYIQAAIHDADTRQLLIAWGGHGGDGILYLGDKSVTPVKYESVHAAVAASPSAIRALLLVDACHSGTAALSPSSVKGLNGKMIAGITAEADKFRLVYSGDGLLKKVGKVLLDKTQEKVQFDHVELYEILRESHRRNLMDILVNIDVSSDRESRHIFVGTEPGIYTLKGVDGRFQTQRFLFFPNE